jgi:hypothetical protein
MPPPGHVSVVEKENNVTVIRQAVDDAAFWRQYICLDCGATEDDEDEGIEEALELTQLCECGGTLRRSLTVLEILDKVEPNEPSSN